MDWINKAAGDRAQQPSLPAKNLELNILQEKESVEDEEQQQNKCHFCFRKTDDCQCGN